MRILRNREDAEDNVQNSLLKAFARLQQFNGNARFSTWLVRIAINEALMALRRSRPIRRLGVKSTSREEDLPESFPDLADNRPNPEQEYAARETVRKAFEELAPAVRDDFVLQKLEGWTNKELAVRRGTQAMKMKSRLFRARTVLRESVRSLTSVPASR